MRPTGIKAIFLQGNAPVTRLADCDGRPRQKEDFDAFSGSWWLLSKERKDFKTKIKQDSMENDKNPLFCFTLIYLCTLNLIDIR